MKIIVIDARELRTSTGRYIGKLLEYLQKNDGANDYLVLLYPKDLESWQPTNKHFTKVACPYKEFTFNEQLGFLKQLRGLKADLVHFGMVQQPILYRGKVVTTMNDLTTTRFRNPAKNWLIFYVKQQIYKLVNYVVAHKSKAILTYTQYVKEDVAKFARINSRKITVTHLAADKITETPKSLPDIENTKFILYVGRPQPHKNLDSLVEAFSIVQQSHPELKLVLAGKKDALYKRLEKQVQKSGVKNIVFTGFVSDTELKWLYENAIAYVFPSLSEGFGLPGLEAMVHGCPVVSSNATCLPEVYGDSALYFDPKNVGDMANKISSVLSNKKLRDELITKGHKQVKKYSWQKMAQQTLDVYNEVLKN